MRTLADGPQLDRLITNLAGSIHARITSDAANDPTQSLRAPWAMVGIRSRGDILAARLVEKIDSQRFKGRVGAVDITLYRDDLSEIGAQPVVRTTDIPFDIDGLNVVLVDDVLMTGRSVRAALQSLMDLGRPRRVWLAVLVNRGGRELPIAPDHVGLDLSGPVPVAGMSLSPEDRVEVKLKPWDDQDAILAVPRSKRS